jgi:hypothetical protein
MKRVRTGSIYLFQPVGVDITDPPYNVRAGDRVRVVALPGCPRPGTMGMCHVARLDGTFGGLVLLASLQRV